MTFAAWYAAALVVLAAVDLATFGAWVAIVTSLTGAVLGIAAYRQGARDAYRLLAEERGRENRRLRAELRRATDTD